jgi:ubiquinone/menaquinone biosynthesis C-methylase UbiE
MSQNASPPLGNEPKKPATFRTLIPIYDLSVLGFSNTFVWKCPTSRILAFYNKHISANHLDIGAGTGYYLDKCRFPSAHPHITLSDVNPNNLQRAANRIARYQPQTCLGNVLEPLPLAEEDFDSIGINYVLHVLPGTMADKAVVFRHLKSLLKTGGTLFGTTILGKDIPHGALARRFLRIYNNKRIFSNLDDSLESLETALKAHFPHYMLSTTGCVAFFAATK